MSDPNQPMSGKVCLVTGATSGIGRVTARELARRGATVVVVGRSRERAEATVDQIRRATGGPAVEFLLADLASQAEIRRLAREFRDRHGRLDVLVNNAGAIFSSRQESPDGIEMTLAVNHLAYFLLTNSLLDLLKAGAPSRVICVASDAHRWARGIDFEDLQGRRNFGALRAYGQSKLANILFAGELARRLAGTGITVIALHPGFVATNIFRRDGWASRLMQLWARLFAISPEEGAKTSIYLATSPEVECVTGQYFVSAKVAQPSKEARDEETAWKLWEISEELTGQPGAV